MGDVRKAPGRVARGALSWGRHGAAFVVATALVASACGGRVVDRASFGGGAGGGPSTGGSPAAAAAGACAECGAVGGSVAIGGGGGTPGVGRASGGGDPGAGGTSPAGGAPAVGGTAGAGGDAILAACEGKPPGATGCAGSDVWLCDTSSSLLGQQCTTCANGACAERDDPCPPSWFEPLLDCAGDCTGRAATCDGRITVPPVVNMQSAAIRTPRATAAMLCPGGGGAYIEFMMGGSDSRLIVAPPWSLHDGPPEIACAEVLAPSCLMRLHSDPSQIVVAVTHDPSAGSRDVLAVVPVDGAGCP